MNSNNESAQANLALKIKPVLRPLPSKAGHALDMFSNGHMSVAETYTTLLHCGMDVKTVNDILLKSMRFTQLEKAA